MTNIPKEKCKQAKDLIDSSQLILVVAHTDPDGDAVGSVLAIAHYLKGLKKEYRLYLYDKPPKYLSFLPGFDEIKTSLSGEKFDLVIAMDYGNFHRLKIEGFVPQDAKILTIDHHIETDHKGEVMLLDKEADSTTQIVYSFFKENGIEITKETASCIFCGMMTDTGVFQYGNTNLDTFESTIELIKKFDFDWEKIIRDTIYCDRTTKTFKIWARALERLEKDENSIMAYTYVLKQDFKDYGATFDEMLGLVDLIKTASDVKFIMFLKDLHDDGVVEVSLRSDESKNFDVARLAMVFGGGGHEHASGFRFKGTIQEAISAVKKELKNKR